MELMARTAAMLDDRSRTTWCPHIVWGRLVVALLVATTLATACGGRGDRDRDRGASSTTTASTTTASTTTTVATDEQIAPEPSSGCGTPPAVAAVAEFPNDAEQHIRLTDGTERSYRLGIPPTYDPATPAPLVLNLHGSGSNAIEQTVYSQMAAKAGDRGMITVTPDAVDGEWQLTATGSDDELLTTLVERIAGAYCVDENRVHIAGMSLGAWKAAVTACAHPDRFASIALVTVEVHPPACGPMPVVAFHGTADRTVPYGEGADPGITVSGPNAALPGARDNIVRWAGSAGCEPDPVEAQIGADVLHWRFEGCDPGVGVELYTVQGGGHTWPGSPITIGATTDTVDATALALDWFESHPLRS